MNSSIRYFLLNSALLALSAGVVHAQMASQETAENIFVGVPQISLGSKSGIVFPAFDASFYENQLFLLGEAHGVLRPQEIDVALFKHLNERAGVRNYVAEVDCAKAYYLNQYLKTGDEALLDVVFQSWEAATSQWANKEFRSKLQQLRVWNISLPQHRQIRFIGLDELQDLPLAGNYVAALIGQAKLPTGLRAPVDSVAALLREPTASSAILAGMAKRAVAGLTAQEVKLRKKNGSAYDDLLHVLENVAYPRRGMAQREKNIFANFKRLYRVQHWEREKLYGFWGLGHVLQSPLDNGAVQFAAMVRQSDLPVHDRVVSLLCVFADCQMLMPSAFLPAAWQETGQRYSQTDKFSHDGPMVLIEGMPKLKERTQPGSTTLFTLNAPGASTNRQPIKISYAPGVPAGQQVKFKAELPATAYAQYLILVRTSPAVQPLKP